MTMVETTSERATQAVVEHKTNAITDVRDTLGKMEGQFKAALPAHIPVERFMRVVMTAIQNNPELLSCDRKSMFNAAMKAAQDGILPDGREGAMVVRKNFKTKTKEVSWQPMIAGIRKKARNSGEIATWDAHIVRDGDHFQFQLGDNPQINHSYDLTTKRGKILGAYSVCVLKDGTKSYEVMTIGEIHEIRDRSDAWKAFKGGFIKSTPWSTDEGEMCRKTVARRHSKVIPMSSDLDDLIRRDDDLYDFNNAREAAQAPATGSLSDRLASLAQAEPPQDANGEIIEHETEASESQTASDALQAAGDTAGRDPSPESSAADPNPWFQRGAFDATAGKSLKVTPRELHEPGRESDLEQYRAGFLNAG